MDESMKTALRDIESRLDHIETRLTDIEDNKEIDKLMGGLKSIFFERIKEMKIATREEFFNHSLLRKFLHDNFIAEDEGNPVFCKDKINNYVGKKVYDDNGFNLFDAFKIIAKAAFDKNELSANDELFNRIKIFPAAL